MKRNNGLYAFLLCLILLGSCGPEEQKKEITYIGNGGNQTTPFLEGIRTALVRTLKIIKAERKKGLDVRPFCRDKMSTLHRADVELCQDFILKTLDQMILFNDGEDKVPFGNWTGDLKVPGIEQVNPSDDAFTFLGAEGPIFFKHGRLALYTPAMALQLMVHENGHKVSYPHLSNGVPKNYIEDGSTVRFISGKYSNAPHKIAIGKEFLDVVGGAVARVATIYGVIGGEFDVEDTFECNVTLKLKRRTITKSFIRRSVRKFEPPRGRIDGYYLGYKTGFGDLFGNRYSFEDKKLGFLYMTMLIEEGNGCQRDSSKRKTSFVLKDERGVPVPMKESVVLDENITCPPHRPATFTYKNRTISCRFKPPSAFVPKKLSPG